MLSLIFTGPFAHLTLVFSQRKGPAGAEYGIRVREIVGHRATSEIGLC